MAEEMGIADTIDFVCQFMCDNMEPFKELTKKTIADGIERCVNVCAKEDEIYLNTEGKGSRFDCKTRVCKNSTMISNFHSHPNKGDNGHFSAHDWVNGLAGNLMTMCLGYAQDFWKTGSLPKPLVKCTKFNPKIFEMEQEALNEMPIIQQLFWAESMEDRLTDEAIGGTLYDHKNLDQDLVDYNHLLRVEIYRHPELSSPCECGSKNK